jgi:lipid A disaccharide synthetase
VPELLQEALTPLRVRDAMLALARQPERQAELRRGLLEATSALGRPGAYERAAARIAEYLHSWRDTSPPGAR